MLAELLPNMDIPGTGLGNSINKARKWPSARQQRDQRGLAIILSQKLMSCSYDAGGSTKKSVPKQEEYGSKWYLILNYRDHQLAQH